MNKRVNGRWIMETKASKKRKIKREKLQARMEELQEKGRLTSKIRKSFEQKIERLNY